MAENLNFNNLKGLYVGSTASRLMQPKNIYPSTYRNGGKYLVDLYSGSRPGVTSNTLQWVTPGSDGWATISGGTGGTNTFKFGVKVMFNQGNLGWLIPSYYLHSRYLLEGTVKNDGANTLYVSNNHGQSTTVGAGATVNISSYGGSQYNQLMWQFNISGAASNAWNIKFKDLKIYDLYDDQIYPVISKPSVSWAETDIRWQSGTGTFTANGEQPLRSSARNIAGNWTSYANTSSNYDRVYLTTTNIYISYVAYSGARRYIRVGSYNPNTNTVSGLTGTLTGTLTISGGGVTTKTPIMYTILAGQGWWSIWDKNKATAPTLDDIYAWNESDATTVIHPGQQVIVGFK